MNAVFRPGGGGVNSICGASAWKRFGLPAMLYGCELWWNLTATENEMLNRTNSFAAKCMQGLPPTTNTVAAIGTLGLWTTSAEIDRRKLRLFLGSLCRASPQYVHKTISYHDFLHTYMKRWKNVKDLPQTL